MSSRRVEGEQEGVDCIWAGKDGLGVALLGLRGQSVP